MIIDFNKLKFRPEDLLGAGFFGGVYKVTNGKDYDDRFVAKLFHQPKLISFMDKLAYGVSFEKETNALKYLGPKNISPKIYYKYDSYSKRYYVMDSMNYTLNSMLINDSFLPWHLNKLTSLLFRLSNTRYRHADLHINNIMWSDRLQDFRIVDWGMYNIDNSNNLKPEINRMMRSGDMYVLIQLYVAYKLESESDEYWKHEFEEFLKYVPVKENVFQKFNNKQLKKRVKKSIKNHIKVKPKKTKKISSVSKNNRFSLNEIRSLLGENSNTGFYEMDNL
jgi:tRNA A-37 threonylcarbamoyl transferase component Bud32